VAALNVVVFGITGRMGQALIRAIRESQQFRLCGAVASSASARLGQEAAETGEATGVTIGADLAGALGGASVALDFSAAACVANHVQACAAAQVPLLVGTTGFDAAAQAELKVAAERIPLLVAPNTSIGVGVLAHLVEVATRELGPSYDVEIAEAHHRSKRDAPSGTALRLGEVVAAARDQQLSDIAVYDRHGVLGPRAAGQVGFSVVRAGDIVGEHTVTFATAGERLEITHRASDRMIFARGALRAAAWLTGQPKGLYGMADVLRREKKHGQ
jgi:4-hydroxy-tetrahydrodipicolinate reductase